MKSQRIFLLIVACIGFALADEIVKINQDTEESANVNLPSGAQHQGVRIAGVECKK